MTKIDIISGFLGAGKTTLIKKLIAQAFVGEQLVIIENEFGQIAIDGGFLKESGIRVTEMNSGCICCSLVGDFSASLQEVLKTYAPDRIIIEPSGVGKLSDVIKAIEDLDAPDLVLNSATTVVDAKKCKVYSKNFGEFFNNQLEHATAVVLSRTADLPPEKLDEVLRLIRSRNLKANILTTPWDQVDGLAMLEAMEKENLLTEKLAQLQEEHHECSCGCCHHEHHHEHHHDHEHDHHHDHDHEHKHHEHHHHHDHEASSCCEHHHEHHHEHHLHHADEVFSSWGIQTTRSYTEQELEDILHLLNDEKRFGSILRAKGIVSGSDGTWLHFDFVPEEDEIRRGGAEVIGSICVIGSHLNEDELSAVFA